VSELTTTGQKIYEMKYAQSGEDWTKTCWRVASYIASAEDDINVREKYEKEFFNLIYNLIFIPGGRVLANAGTGIKNLMNCFVLNIDDSRVSIYETLKTAAEIFANGGGIGFNFSKIREEGAKVDGTGGKASGPLSFMNLFDTTGDVISQASRRGAQIGILDCDHPDIVDFINYKSTPNIRTNRLLEEYKRNLKYSGLNADGHKYFSVLMKTLQDDQLSHFNISALLTDKFMNAVQNNEDWELISRKTKSQVKTIKAKELFSLMAQKAWESGDPGVMFYDRANEDNMVKYLGDLNSSNPCIVGDTKILTVYDGEVSIRDLVGKEVLVYCWNPETKLMEISMMNNIRKTRENSELVEVEFDSGLKIKCTPDHSLYTFRGEKVQVKDLEIGQSIRAFSMSLHSDGHYRVHGWVKGKSRHQYVARMVWEYYNGHIEKDLILHHKDFNKVNNEIDNLELVTNSKHNIIHSDYRRDGGYYRRGRNHKITNIKYLEEREDVYNGNVVNNHNYIIVDPKAIAGTTSGIVSANCSEIWLLPNESCCLGSINLHEFYDKENNSINFPFLEYVVRTSVRFLDDVQTKSEAPLEEINKWTKGLRRLGLGVFGWADLLAELGIPYDSENAFNLAKYLSWFISFFGWLESINLAEEKGAFPFYDSEKVDLSIVENTLNNSPFAKYKFNMEEIRRKGLRNVAITAIAPTGSIALLSGCVVGDTLIHTINGNKKIKDIIGTTQYVYSSGENEILVKKAFNIRKTRENAEVWKIKFDTDDELILTPDHKIMLSNGEWKETRDLVLGDSVRSFKKSLQNNKLPTLCLSMTGLRLKFDHLAIAECLIGRKLFNNEVIHHINENHFDNSIDNLVVIDKKDHYRIHSTHISLWSMDNIGKTYNEIFGDDRANDIKLKQFIKKEGKNNPRYGHKLTDEEKKLVSIKTKEAMNKPEVKEKLSKRWKEHKEKENHKVINIEFYGYEDVYNMEVEDTENYVANNVIVHNCNSGIEPYFALAYKRNITEGSGNTAKDHVVEINPILFNKLKELNFSDSDIDEVKKEILKTGTLENLEKIPEKLRSEFKTAHEINPFKHVDALASWQTYTHNSISKTINLNEDATEKDIEDIYMYAWNEKVKGLTCYRNRSKLFQILNVGVKEKEVN
jgi:ribonucleotide reductase alpha subunit